MTAEVSPLKASAGGHLVEDGPEGEQVGPRIQFFPLGLFRGHIRNSAQCRARAGEMLFAPPCGVVSPDLALRLGGTATFASPKSRILAWPRSVTKMFAGLMSRWTIPFVCAASRASAISMASDSSCLQLQRTVADQVLKGLRHPGTPWR